MTGLAKRIIAIGFAVVLVLAALAAPAYAYFTDTLLVSGKQKIELGYDSEVTENLDDNGNKTISLKNTGKTDIMVRVMLFGAVDREGVSVSVSGEENWKCTEGQGSDQQVWFYDKVLAPGETSSLLKVDVSVSDTTKTNPYQFDITVVGQTSPAAYDENGNPYAFNWK